ncbi:MAG: DUF58 domain-containing protein [Xanthomonadales bacterium]|nr:DUF58 domain-containing protein [Gammaproteobacteria bacterium]MBT8052130.1 DUF58 domain-containing protein [Gammaproteobacteria bacterium]MBT8057498.1 DUF58 domain-containing protein [Gammaproteobacteria bacterium]NNL05602.1 DUF58 domain-containing protein [Xanthomonadales bacterium]
MESVAGSEDFQPAGRFDRWLLERVHSRRGVTALPHTLEYRDVYVLPTGFGAWFGLLLALMLVGGLNFNNNMTLGLGFLLASIALLTTLLAYRNLVNITVHGVMAKPVFCGETATFRILLHSDEGRHRFAVSVLNDEGRDCDDLPPQSTVRLELTQQTWQRGWMEMDPFRAETRYPLGMFRAWSVLIPRARCLVYPQPAAQAPALPKTGRGEYGAARPGEGEHFHGLREYQPGDPIRQIAWKASARHTKLYSRQMESPREEACELNWYLMGSGNTEEKLSILTAWILRAERLQIPYSLEMPGAALPADLGEEHRDACLEILALFNP